MEIMHIESKYNEQFLLPKQVIKELQNFKGKIFVVTPIQFHDSLTGIKEQLEDSGLQTEYFKGKHAKYPGQILGCSLNEQENLTNNDAFLYIGTGDFHPKALLLVQDVPVYKYNPLNQQFQKLDMQDVEILKKRKMGALLKFKTSNDIGIIISTKPGQNRMVDAQKLKVKLESEGKNAYLFVTDTLNFQELENFPFVECWVNTMCPRIGLDDFSRAIKPILNIDFIV